MSAKINAEASKFGEVIFGKFQYEYRANKVSGLGLHSSFH